MIAQVQDDFYGNVGTYKVFELKLMRLVDNKNRVLSLRTEIRFTEKHGNSVVSNARKIGGSNPPLGTKDLVVQLVRILPCHGSGRGFESRLDRYVQKYNI